MRYKIPEEWFEKHVKHLQDIIKTAEDMPPLIVHYAEHEFERNDGNHRSEAYKRLGITEYPVIVWMTEKANMRNSCKNTGIVCQPIVRRKSSACFNSKVHKSCGE